MNYLRLKSAPAVKSFEDYFDGFFSPAPSFFREGKNFPAVNVSESKDKFSVELLAPGRKKEDFKIHVNGNLLEISSEQKEETSTEGENYTRKEFKLSSFSRTFSLPETVNAANINAEYADGILKLTLPKKEEAKEKGKIQIAVS